MAQFETLHRIRTAAALMEVSQLALGTSRCPVCGPSLLVRISSLASGVRCLICGASAATLSLVGVLQDLRPSFPEEPVYEMSSRGALYEFFRKRAREFTCSEFFEDVAPGAWRGGVQCQDVRQLTFPDASFGLCTSTEVFEHVADDTKGFAEIRRILRPGGLFIFTVPLSNAPVTVERAAIVGGEIRHLLPPAYHADRIRGNNKVLVFRDYGHDIVDRLRGSGFADAWIDRRFSGAFLGSGAPVVVAQAS